VRGSCYDDGVSDPIDILRGELHDLEEAVPLAPYCAYGVGGPAELLYTARTTGELAHAARTARELRLPLTVLGGATNVLISDAGLPGLTVLARNEASSLDGELLKFEDLRAGHAVLVLKPGFTVRGIVVDPAGKPMPGVRVKDGPGAGISKLTS